MSIRPGLRKSTGLAGAFLPSTACSGGAAGHLRRWRWPAPWLSRGDARTFPARLASCRSRDGTRYLSGGSTPSRRVTRRGRSAAFASARRAGGFLRCTSHPPRAISTPIRSSTSKAPPSVPRVPVRGIPGTGTTLKRSAIGVLLARHPPCALAPAPQTRSAGRDGSPPV